PASRRGDAARPGDRVPALYRSPWGDWNAYASPYGDDSDPNRPHWTVLRETFPSQQNYDRRSGRGDTAPRSGGFGTGFNNASGALTVRLVFEIKIGQVAYAHIGNAKFNIWHSWSGAGCGGGGGHPVDLYQVSPFDASASWNSYNPSGSMGNWYHYIA